MDSPLRKTAVNAATHASAAASVDDGPIARVLSVLEAVMANEEPASLRDVELRAGLPKATAHRILTQLERMGWLERSLGPKLYLPGPRLAAVALRTLKNRWLPYEGHRILTEVVAIVDETCNMTVLDGFEVLIVDRVESAFPLRYVLEVNSRYPLHCTASGKIFLAWMSERRRSRYLETHVLEKRATGTAVHPPALKAQLAKAHQQGYAIDNQELIAGLVAIAVPIISADGDLLGTISINAAAARRSVADLVRFVPVLQDSASKLASIAGITAAQQTEQASG